jgi:membrane-bound lytic murein transglycosylase D
MEGNPRPSTPRWHPAGQVLGASWLLALVLLWSPASLASQSGAFPRPPELEPDIRFWTRVYTEIDTHQGFIHDSRHLNVVYETVQLNPNLSPRGRSKQVKRVKKRYKKVLLKLAGGQRHHLSAEERRVLSLWPEDVSKRELRAAARRLRFQLGQSDKFRAGLIRSGAWDPYIRETLARMGLPEELAALPHVESSYNPKAHSHLGAAGLWQFTRPTGRRYMRVDHVVDQRLDPHESTVAAARLLKHNHDVTGSWPLAITAYNHGAAGMRRAARKLGTRDISVIVRRYKSRSFGFASRNFYVAFLAALGVAEHADGYFGPLQREAPASQEVVEVPAFMPIEALAEALQVDEAVLRAHNPALQDSVWRGAKYVPRGYPLRIPADENRGFVEALLAAVPSAERFPSQRPDRFHRVVRGDTLSGIARRYDTSVGELVALNGLRSRHRIRVGQVLRLPIRKGGATVVAMVTVPSTEAPPADGLYTVERGDTLSIIAHRFGVEEQALLAANELSNPHWIYAGQTLRLDVPQTDPENGTGKPIVAAIAAPVVETAATPPAPPQSEAAEIEDQEETESLDSSVSEAVQPELTADPSDYTVAEDGWIEVQAAETLGHYADWLEIRTQRLRRLNRMAYGEPVMIGRRLQLDFSKVTPEVFERRRLEYHRALQEDFFQRFQIAGTCRHVVRPGDSLWSLSRETYAVPVWLLRQYNPDLDFAAIPPGKEVEVPLLQRRDADPENHQAREEAGPSTC